MPDYGITPEGFNRKRLDQLKAELDAAVRAIFGDNVNLEPESPDGQINGVVSESNANLWELLEEGYNAFNPSVASGVALSNLVQLNNITRLPATPSLVELSLTGSDGTLIPSGSIVSTSDTGAQFATDEDVTISGGVGTVDASSIDTGPIGALSGTLTVIETPITGWDSVTNATDATLGANLETDPELRARRANSTAAGGQSVLDSLHAAVANVPGVTSTTVLENTTNVTDGDGNPPKSTHAIVSGGDDDAIALAIWQNKSAGIEAFGSTTVVVPDSQGITHDISFSRPTDVPIYVIVNLTTNSDYPADGDTRVAQAIVDYAAANFALGDDVIYSRLYTPINSVPGHQIDSLFIDITPAPAATANIPIASTEVALFTVANITVNS